jgi:hypothetical protein
MIQIRNGLRFNIYASAVIDGVRYPNFTDRSVWAKVGITEVEEPDPPFDFGTGEGWIRQEIDEAPYVTYRPMTAEEMRGPVPQQITRAQGKVVLLQMGMWPQVVGFVNSIEDPMQKAIAEVAVYETLHWQRESEFLNTAAAVLGITDEQMDELFIQASKVML